MLVNICIILCAKIHLCTCMGNIQYIVILGKGGCAILVVGVKLIIYLSA